MHYERAAGKYLVEECGAAEGSYKKLLKNGILP
jgi:hypothetical protein